MKYYICYKFYQFYHGLRNLFIKTFNLFSHMHLFTFFIQKYYVPKQHIDYNVHKMITQPDLGKA